MGDKCQLQVVLLLILICIRKCNSAVNATVFYADDYSLFKNGKFCRPIIFEEKLSNGTVHRAEVPSILQSKSCPGVEKGLEILQFENRFPYALKITISSSNFQFNYAAAMDLANDPVNIYPMVPIGGFFDRKPNGQHCDDTKTKTRRIIGSKEFPDFCGNEKTFPFGRKKYSGFNTMRSDGGLTSEKTTFYWQINWESFTENKTAIPAHFILLFWLINTIENPPTYCGPLTSKRIYFRNRYKKLKEKFDTSHDIDCLFGGVEATAVALPTTDLPDKDEFANFVFPSKSNHIPVDYKNQFFLTDLPTAGKPNTQWDSRIPDIYDGCFVTKGCLGDTENCIKDKNCKVLITWRTGTKLYFIFELLAPQAADFGYVAMGLSKDRRMGKDLCIECVRQKSGEVGVYQSFNTMRENKRFSVGECPGVEVKNCTVISSDSKIYCKFHRHQTINRKGVFDILKERFYLLVVYGNMTTPDNIGPHTKDNILISKNTINLNEVVQKKNSRLKVTVHVICMIFCWVVFVPNAIFVARYLKETYTSAVIIDRKLWFFIHSMSMSTGFLLCLVGISSILMARFDMESRWPSIPSSILHAQIGGSSSVVFLGQVISGWYRPMGHNSRRTYSFVHWLIGTIIYFLALYNMFTSYYMGMPCDVYWYFLAAILWLLLWHGIMIYHFVWLDTNLGLKKCRALRPLPIKVVLFEDAPGKKQRTRIAIINFIGSVGFAIGISLLYHFRHNTCPCTTDFCSLSI